MNAGPDDWPRPNRHATIRGQTYATRLRKRGAGSVVILDVLRNDPQPWSAPRPSRGESRMSEAISGLTVKAFLALVLTLVAAVGCGGGNNLTSPSESGPFELVFSLDASFQSVHGGHPISIAVVRSSNGSVVARENGVVSPTQNPSFRFATGRVMLRGATYEVHYWIDSNIGGGSPGACDPRAIDHQWSVEFLSVTNDIMFVTSFNPALTEDVCRTFT